MGDYTAIIQIVMFAASIALAAVWLKSQAAKQNHAELEKLAETRGKVIEDLRHEVDELRRDMAELKGQLKMLQALKTAEIVDGVLEGINHEMMNRWKA